MRWIVGMLVVPLAQGIVAAQDVTTDQLAQSYARQRMVVQSFYIEYTSVATGLIDLEQLKKHKVMAYLPLSDLTYAAKGQARYCRKLDQREDQKQIAIPEQILVYDGEVFLERRPHVNEKIRTFNKHYPDKIAGHLTSDYSSMIAFDHPALSEKSGSVSEHLASGKATLAPHSETVAEARCVVLEVPGTMKYWLDPGLGFAVRRAERFRNEKREYAVECADFTEVAPGIWLPRQVDWYRIGSSDLPAELCNQKLVRYRLTVKRLEVNNPEHDSLFSTRVPAGSLVHDVTMPPLNPDGTLTEGKRKGQAITYIQPADDQDLDKVVFKAQVTIGRVISKTTVPKKRTLYFWLAGAGACFVVLYLARRWDRRRSVKSELPGIPSEQGVANETPH